MEHRTGFEPATSRVAGEVTEIFTTDRDGVGGERSILLLLFELTELRHFSRRELSPRPPANNRDRRSDRSNRHLHHRQADAFESAFDGYAGERAISAFSDDNTGTVLANESCAGPRASLSRGRIPVRVSKAGGIPAFLGEKYPRSSPPASVEPRDSRQTDSRKFYRGAVDAPQFANHSGSLCHRCPAHRLVPSGRPRALGHALLQREPRDPGLPFRHHAGVFERAARRAIKNPPERLAREGP